MKRLIDAIIAKWFTVPEWKLEIEIQHKSHENDKLPHSRTRLYKCNKTGKFKKIEL